MSEQDPQKKIVGKISFLYIGAERVFTSKIDFLNSFRYELDVEPGAISYKLNSDDPNFRRAVNHLIHTALGDGESRY